MSTLAIFIQHQKMFFKNSHFLKYGTFNAQDSTAYVALKHLKICQQESALDQSTETTEKKGQQIKYHHL